MFKVNVDVIGMFMYINVVDVYRGVGCLEVIYLLECMLDLVVLEMGKDFVKLCL